MLCVLLLSANTWMYNMIDSITIVDRIVNNLLCIFHLLIDIGSFRQAMTSAAIRCK